jgi:hypothetical protein
MIDEIVPEAAPAADDDGWAALAAEVADQADDEITPSTPEVATAVTDIAPQPESVEQPAEAAVAEAAVAEAAVAEAAVAETAEAAVAETAEAETAPAETVATETAAAAAGGAAPAGWYADPSSRFELRYWDGAQWTEHVSRAGQQYTDPPVA